MGIVQMLTPARRRNTIFIGSMKCCETSRRTNYNSNDMQCAPGEKAEDTHEDAGIRCGLARRKRYADLGRNGLLFFYGRVFGKDGHAFDRSRSAVVAKRRPKAAFGGIDRCSQISERKSSIHCRIAEIPSGPLQHGALQ